MSNNPSSQIATGFKFLGFYQIIGGLIGLVLLLLLLGNQDVFSLWLTLLLLIAFSLYAYSIFCGILLLKKKASGLKHSTINQFLQLVSFAFLGYSYQFASGIIFSIGIDLTKSFDLKYYLGISTWAMSINSDSQVISINLNLVALFLIIYISKLKVKVETQWMENKISEIGNPVI